MANLKSKSKPRLTAKREPKNGTNDPFFTRVKHALQQHYEKPLEHAFKQFRDGAIYFSVGLIVIYLSHTYMQPSIIQELVFILALMLTGFGFLKAMLAQTRLIIGRLYRFWKK